MINKTKKNKNLIKLSILGVIFSYLFLFISCPEPFYTNNINTPVESGYGLIRVNFIGEEGGRTVHPSFTFSKYEYTFTKAGGNSEEKTPDNNGFFSLEIGNYTVAVKAYTGSEGSYILAANGVSSQFTVSLENNTSVEVRLSSVNTTAKGQFNYTIIYPTGASAEINLLRWPDNNVVTLNPVNVSQGNGKTQTLQLDAGSYLFTVLIKKDGYYEGVSEAIHINSSTSTIYTKQFNDDDLLESRTPLSSDYNISGTGTFLYDGNQKSIIITPKVNASSGTITIYYEGTEGTVYTKSTTAPVNIGTYNVTIDIEAVPGWIGVLELPVGTISITIPVISINTHPTSRNVTVGSISGSLTVSANVTQGATLSYQWYSNTSNSNAGGTSISGATSSSYTIPTTLTAGTYYYFVEVKGTNGAISVFSNVATITVTTPVAVTFNNVTANGSSLQTTTQITLTFSQAITGLTASDITLNGVSGVQKGTLISSGTTYTLPISNFYSSGTLNISISKSGYSISGSPKNIDIFYYTPNIWSKTITAGANGAEFRSVTTDKDGNVYAVGRQFSGSGTINYGNGVTATVVSSGWSPILVKYNSSGTAQWARTIAHTGSFSSVAVDSSNNIYVTGIMPGNTSINFGNNVFISSNALAESLVLVKYNSSGTAQWAKTVTASSIFTLGNSFSSFSSVAVDNSGNVYAVGEVRQGDTFDFGNGVTISSTIPSSSGTFIPVLVKYNSSGTAQWARTTTRVGYFNSVAIDSSGNVYVAGNQISGSAIDYGNGVVLTSAYDDGAVLVKYNSSGNAIWAKSNRGNSREYYVAVQGTNNVYLYAGTYNNGGQLVKYNSSGTTQWTKNIIQSGGVSFKSIAVDSIGNIFVVGCFSRIETFNFEDGVTISGLVSGSNLSGTPVLVKYNTSGITQWAITGSIIPTSGSTFNSITVDNTGYIYVVGSQGSGNFNYGSGLISGHSSNNNPIILKYVGD